MFNTNEISVHTYAIYILQIYRLGDKVALFFARLRYRKISSSDNKSLICSLLV